MKYLAVGLGNPGIKYSNTRHNIGFKVLDHLAQDLAVPFESVTHGHMATGKHKGRTIYMLKPNTYMNLSGKAVNYWMQKLKIKSLDRVLVVVDDIHIDFEVIRIRKKGSHGGHNGLRNIQEVLQTQEYPRLRMGIGQNFYSGQQIDFVLGEWSADEEAGLPLFIQNASEAIKSYFTIGPARTMNEFNTK
ncbi:aminoacyl-tRNA hydrolase [Membranihabitans marinus]|uniref:aminoacyl-tRNA hydrolase n=1 Tax=Membranihabitans marinus TaxID=1227546 RepID=UPI001EFFFC91|nr:aminoacyl-tRNA hydrolase [Membranihabitans marinus]